MAAPCMQLRIFHRNFSRTAKDCTRSSKNLRSFRKLGKSLAVLGILELSCQGLESTGVSVREKGGRVWNILRHIRVFDAISELYCILLRRMRRFKKSAPCCFWAISEFLMRFPSTKGILWVFPHFFATFSLKQSSAYFKTAFFEL